VHQPEELPQPELVLPQWEQVQGQGPQLWGLVVLEQTLVQQLVASGKRVAKADCVLVPVSGLPCMQLVGQEVAG
jgi:hypothetical protein